MTFRVLVCFVMFWPGTLPGWLPLPGSRSSARQGPQRKVEGSRFSEIDEIRLEVVGIKGGNSIKTFNAVEFQSDSESVSVQSTAVQSAAALFSPVPLGDDSITAIPWPLQFTASPRVPNTFY